jgi:hypothetical protein
MHVAVVILQQAPVLTIFVLHTETLHVSPTPSVKVVSVIVPTQVSMVLALLALCSLHHVLSKEQECLSALSCSTLKSNLEFAQVLLRHTDRSMQTYVPNSDLNNYCGITPTPTPAQTTTAAPTTATPGTTAVPTTTKSDATSAIVSVFLLVAALIMQ